MRYDEAVAATRDVGGWLSPAEGRLLYELGRCCTGRGCIVEIGSWQGKSTIHLAAGSRAGAGRRVIAIDPHTGSPEHQESGEPVSTFEAFERNIERAGVADLVEPIVAPSAEAVALIDEPVELVFIDGAHEPDMVRLDFDLYVPKLVEGGWVALHDTVAWPGPRQVAIRDVFRSPRFRQARFADSIAYGQRVERATALERLANHRALLGKLVYERGRRLPLPKPLLTLGKRLLVRLTR